MQYFYFDKNGKRHRYYYCSDCRARFTEDQLNAGVQNYGTLRNPIILCDKCSVLKFGPNKTKTALDEEPEEQLEDTSEEVSE